MDMKGGVETMAKTRSLVVTIMVMVLTLSLSLATAGAAEELLVADFDSGEKPNNIGGNFGL